MDRERDKTLARQVVHVHIYEIPKFKTGIARNSNILVVVITTSILLLKNCSVYLR